jgi:uncharacterized protein involved in exopolysaccharide biosynthesis
VSSVAAATTLLAAAFAFLTPPVYRAATVVVPAANGSGGLNGALSSALGSFGGLAALAGVRLGSEGSQTDEALAVLRSRNFTARFIADKNLIPLLFPDKWDAASSKWKSGLGEIPTMSDGLLKFDRSIRSINNDRKTGLITLAIDWTDRQLAADWANELVRRINAEMRVRAIAKADAYLKYLRAELDATTVVETRQVINSLIETQINQRMLANVNLDYSFRVVDPAMVPDVKDVLRPKRLMIVAVGLMVGLFLGSLSAFLFGPREGPAVGSL